MKISELRDSNPKKEALAIRNSLKSNELTVVLDEKSDPLSSIQFANHLKTFENQRLVFIIGGSDGIDSEIKNLASWKFSLSPLTFPHEMARLILIEQLFRAQSILQGSPYHRI